MSDATTKACRFCQTEIHIDATVCPHCQRHQGTWGRFVNYSIVLTMLISLAGAVFSGIQAASSASDLSDAKRALEKAEAAQQESKKNAELAAHLKDYAVRAAHTDFLSKVKELSLCLSDFGHSDIRSTDKELTPIEVARVSDEFFFGICFPAHSELIESFTVLTFIGPTTMSLTLACRNLDLLYSRFSSKTVVDNIFGPEHEFRVIFEKSCGKELLSPK